MGEVIRLMSRNRHGRGSRKNPKTSNGSHFSPHFSSSSESKKKYSAGMQPLSFQALTVARLTPVADETAEVPKASKTSAAVVSISSHTLHFERLSTPRRLGLVNLQSAMYARRMSRQAQAIAARLTRLQDALGLKHQVELAKLAGVRDSSWSEIMAADGKRGLSKRAAINLKDATGVTLDWLYTGDTSGLPLHIAHKLRQGAA